MTSEQPSHVESRLRRDEELSPGLRRVETQERVVVLAAKAQLSTRAIERALRSRSWRLTPIGTVEHHVISEHIDEAIEALTAIMQELGNV